MEKGLKKKQIYIDFIKKYVEIATLFIDRIGMLIYILNHFNKPQINKRLKYSLKNNFMKQNILSKLLGVSFLILLASTQLVAQTGLGEIRGKIATSDELDQGKVLAAKVFLYLPDNTRKKTVYPEPGGNYYIKNVTPGEYFIKVMLKGYDTAQTALFEVSADKITDFDITLTKVEDKPTDGKVTVIKKVVVRSNSALGREDNGAPPIGSNQLVKGASRSPGGIIAGTVAGVNANAGGALSFLGSRTDGTAVIVDGVRVRGGSNVNTQSLGQVNVIIGGVPAQYGDFTGGAISYTTKGISNRHNKSFEILSSSPFGPYHHNTAEFFANGPLYIKNKGADANDTTTGPERTVLGYLFNVSARYRKDPSPSYIGYYIVNEDKLAEIQANPLVPNTNGAGFVHAGNFVTEADLENIKARPNARSLGTTIQGKVDWAPSKNTLITFYGSYGYGDGLNAGRSLFNYNNNSRSISTSSLAYIRFRQDLPNPSNEAMLKKTTLSKAWYNIRFDYQSSSNLTRDQVHLDNIFDYGYIGAYTKYPTEFYGYYNNNNNPFAAPRTFVDQNGDTVTLTNFHEQIGFVDTALRFTRSELNPLRANYTSNLFEDFDRQGFALRSESNIRLSQGLVNGDNPPNLYGLWAAPGQVSSNYSKSSNEFFSVLAMGEASLTGPLEKDLNRKPHDLQFGLFFEQSSFNSYGLNANGLWFLMPQLANTHIQQLDRNNPILTYNSDGVFTDTVKYNRLVQADQQTFFDQKLRESLINNGAKDVYGNPYNSTTFIDVNGLSPDQLNIDMFNANELLNNGNSYVSYRGYDHLGNRVRGRSSLNDFLQDPNKRAVNGFNPIYTAAWIQDKFDFKDLIFRIGLRVERYDANQLVLKDPYSLYPVRTAAEVKELNGLQTPHPDGIGDEYKVYVNDVDNPTKILGYRNQDQWYDAQGNEISNPDLIANQTSNGEIAPYLVNTNDQELSENSFEDYKPEVNILPRVWFSFPINTSALFFANYDVLAQRPSNNFMTIDNYFYLETRNNQTFANPALKPRLKTNYEIGFRQVLSEQRFGKGIASIIGITASYSEIRNDINQFFFNNAYPISYISYSNIDFSTVKSFRTDFQLKKDKTLTFNANYSLLFANGTGSNPNSSRALIQSNQPNLRTLIPLGDLDIRHSVKANLNYDFGGGKNPRTGKSNYFGPEHLKKYLEFASAGLIFTSLSGLPYTAKAQPEQIGSTDRAQIKGNPFGSRLPWTSNVNLQLSKGFGINYAKGQKQGVLYTFVIISNVLNTENVVSVWPYTGQPNDDGFLSSPRGQQAVSNQINAESYQALYRVINNNPGFYRGPRFAQLGLRFQF